MIQQQKSILMAVIGAAHGLKGEVRIKSFSDDPFALSRYHVFYDNEGRKFRILNLRQHKAQIIAQIEGVTNRDGAQLLRGVQLFVDRQFFDDDLEEDEFYQADLIGFHALTFDGTDMGEEIGHISGFFNFGAGDLVEISDKKGKSWLVPFSHMAVPVIDKDKRQIGVDRLAAGLVDVLEKN